jgi:hypothetical protein
VTAEGGAVREGTDQTVPPARARDELRREVADSRDVLARLRSSGAAPVQCRGARERLCDALEAYTLLLTESHIPVPYSVRDELWLLKHVPW